MRLKMIYMDTIVLGYMKGCVVEAVAGQTARHRLLWYILRLCAT